MYEDIIFIQPVNRATPLKTASAISSKVTSMSKKVLATSSAHGASNYLNTKNITPLTKNTKLDIKNMTTDPYAATAVFTKVKSHANWWKV
jgi:hypothetical protein